MLSNGFFQNNIRYDQCSSTQVYPLVHFQTCSLVGLNKCEQAPKILSIVINGV